jgi:AraC-like DNA-binding protein
MGSGHIYASNISSDISYVILDFRLKDDLTLFRKKTSAYGLALSFNQIEISDFFRLTEKNVSVTTRSPRLSNIYLSSTNVEMEMVFSKNSAVRIVVVFFSPHFIRKCVKKEILVDLQMYTDNGPENIYRDPITFEYKNLLDEIFKTDTASPLSNLALQNRVLMLTEKFLAAFLEKESENGKSKIPKLKEKDMQALKEVEEILSKPELDKFPSIEVLSKTAMMSSTKLKTKFKSVYGMKLYEYYNRNRLEKAKELLQSGRYSVKEVGLDIGFSNLSNFAKAFKKEFGILPNEMLRMSQNAV